MITLRQAMRLCDVEDCEFLNLIRDGQTRRDAVYASGRLIRETLDLRKVYVVRIEPIWEMYGPDYDGLLFTLRNITVEELQKLQQRQWTK